MKAKHIKKIRAKLKDKNFLNKQLKIWAYEEKLLDNFYTFKCSEIFEGKTGAEINKIEYYRRRSKCNRKLEMLKKLLENT